MQLPVDKSVYPLFFFIGSSLTMATGFSFHNLFFRPEVKLWKKDRMELLATKKYDRKKYLLNNKDILNV